MEDSFYSVPSTSAQVNLFKNEAISQKIESQILQYIRKADTEAL